MADVKIQSLWQTEWLVKAAEAETKTAGGVSSSLIQLKKNLKKELSWLWAPAKRTNLQA
jgi:hypothetical protein